MPIDYATASREKSNALAIYTLLFGIVTNPFLTILVGNFRDQDSLLMKCVFLVPAPVVLILGTFALVRGCRLPIFAIIGMIAALVWLVLLFTPPMYF